ncbi:DNA repair and recombination protein RAD54B-like [Haliotis rufescens]|uniref:DNA repair and recombination protein RAD54B-like n=1 Tax=Haliotis rufescens TaxID=6454 RepID=UPI00201F3A7D|nr:DNA repair and recombination protein RAD54B-like [Haliotis rufescens]
MRRSAAPSQLNPAKRTKFSVPFKNPNSSKVHETEAVVSEPKKTGLSNLVSTSDVSSSPSIAIDTEDEEPGPTLPVSGGSNITPPLEQDNGATTHIDKTQASSTIKSKFSSPILGVSKFRSPLGQVGDRNTPHIQNARKTHMETSASATKLEATTQKNYLSVVWCKRSKKKHKKWEGDAVLVTHGRSVTLYDTESKEIGRGSGYKASELAFLKDDETLCVGGKEIQVMSVLTEEQFTSGKCFTSSAGSVPLIAAQHNTGIKKPFVDPNKDNTAPQVRTDICVKPRFDPTAPGALVMRRPHSSHQWEFNRQKLAVLDVVVDPYLSSHLRAHQRDGVSFLYECVMGFRDFAGQGAILADDMGLGKTLQCITMLWTLLKQGPYGGKPVIRRALIITPGSLVKNWFQEFKKWLGSERLKVFAVTANNRVEEYTKTAIYPVLIMSYEMFVRAYKVIQEAHFDIVICDEGHRLKNTTIKTTSLIMSLPTRRRVILTGTPIQNDLKEFFSIVEFCNPGILGSSAAFHRVYEDPIVASRQPGASLQQVSLGEERGAELTRLTKMFILRRTQEINNKYLPPKVELVIFCQASRLQLCLYHQFLQCRLMRRCLSGNVEGAPHLICIAALKQLCNHPNLVLRKAMEPAGKGGEEEESVYSGLLPYFPEDASLERVVTRHSGKLVALSSILQSLHSEEPREKVVLVSNHTKTLNMLQVFCDNVGFRWVRLDGQTPTSQRQDIVNKFNSKHSQETVFLLSSKAGGVGLNLVGASRLILYDIDWNPANDLQAMARVWRDGQSKKVYIYRLLTTGSIEEKVYQRQISKQGLSGAVMDLRERNDVQFSREDLKDLFTLSERTACDTHTLLDCQCGGKGVLPSDTVTHASETSRPCQLGAPAVKSHSKKNLSMDELLDWHHLSGENSANFDPSWHISGAEDVISFVFWNESKMTSFS